MIKVKSLATDEIGLNEALETEGIHAIETDLAELIVQLDPDDKQSHILVPAIHRNRAEIRALFERTIAQGQDLGNEATAIAEAARRHLRAKFLSVPVAVSGTNFGIAETGTIGVVESEGNGRMCLTLPKVLVTLMGIEKVLPEWRDLEVFLQLLPRSSTAERMNPYTSLWTGVRENDGPQEFHLVLLDGGRTSVLADEVGRQALHCIRCSACLNVCPVYERVGGQAYESVYPGPIGAILTPLLRGLDQAPTLPWASSLCGACYEVCPVKIDIPSVLVHLRGRVVREEKSKFTPEALAMKGMAAAFGSRRRYEAAQRLARLGRGPLAKAALPGWTAMRELPEPPKETFRDWWKPAPSAPPRRDDPWRPRVSDAKAAILAASATPRPRSGRARHPARVPARRHALPRRHRRPVLRARRRVPRDRAPRHRRAAAVREILAGAERIGVPPELADLGTVVDDDLSVAELDTLDAIVTGCALAIADTGTIVLDSGPASGRRALTLVPDHHVCIVRAAGHRPLRPRRRRRAGRRRTEGRPITLVSGPSATSDIELDRVEGVHGPRTLDVIVTG